MGHNRTEMEAQQEQRYKLPQPEALLVRQPYRLI
jgi:hypothetical protein